MFYVTTAFFFYWLFFRRFQTPRYSSQKFSRSNQFLLRSTVPPLKVPWSVPYTDYAPVKYETTDHPWWFRTTRLDGKVRLLVEVSARLFTKMPINPYGRTGATGKGALLHSGPNKITLTVFWSSTGGYAGESSGKLGKRIHHGYVDHPLNTDNAWIEAEVFVHEDFSQTSHGGEKPECPPWLKKILKNAGY